MKKDDLALALKGASDEIKDLFFANMSERAGKMMQEDMEAMGSVRMKDVETAQVNTVQACKETCRTKERLSWHLVMMKMVS